jgi:ribosomal protein L37AE/L43A
MAKTAMYVCQSCGNPTGTRIKNGYFECTDDKCGAIWWDVFDRPSAGIRVKGYECYNCNRKTMQSIAKIAGVNVRRCTKCGRTLLER